MSEPVRYHAWPGGWLFLGAMTVVLLGAAGWVAVATITTIGDPRTYPVNLVWIVLTFSGAYRFVYRLAFSLTFDGRVLMWSTLIRSGAVDLDEITAIRSRRIMKGVVDFESNSAPTVSVQGTKRLSGFIDEILAVRPDIPVDLHRRLSESTEQ